MYFIMYLLHRLINLPVPFKQKFIISKPHSIKCQNYFHFLKLFYKTICVFKYFLLLAVSIILYTVAEHCLEKHTPVAAQPNGC